MLCVFLLMDACHNTMLQAQSAAHVRGALRTPFALKDATSVSIVSQSASGVLNDTAIARVISTTTPLTPAQLVVTQQKPGIVGVSTVPQGLHIALLVHFKCLECVFVLNSLMVWYYIFIRLVLCQHAFQFSLQATVLR